MSQKAFALTAGVVFLLIALGHLLRVVLGVSFVVHEIAVPMWASLIAVVITGYLAYEGFHFARKTPPKA
jgi:dolichyl-phosphate-mannose--protein O-mannosyl transferase